MIALQDLLKDVKKPRELEVPLPLTGLDIALANYLNLHQPSDDPRHWWLTALTSHQWSQGHACLDLTALSTQTAALLGWSQEHLALLPTHLGEAASTLPGCQGDNSPLVLVHDVHNSRLYLRRAWMAEQQIRHRLNERLALPCEAPADLQSRLDALFGTAANLQRTACEVAVQNRITLITGGPGTGKTTTVVKLLALLVGASAETLRIHLAAPTGKAAARLSESIRKALQDMPADVQANIPTQTHTLHRLLQVHRHRMQAVPLATDVVVVDEASMIDLEMMTRLLQAVPSTARLILLGDKDQLASVEAGAVMAQLCTGSLLRKQTVTLTYSHRFDAQGGIGQWAQAVNAAVPDNTPALQALWSATPDWLTCLASAEGEHEPTLPDVTRLQIAHAHEKPFAAGLRHGWRTWLNLLRPHLASASHASSPCSDAQAQDLLNAFTQFAVLAAVREGPLGVVQLNAHIEQALDLGHHTWYAGRPVMVTRNNYSLGLMNGDIGLCLPAPDGVLRVAFPGPKGGVRWVMPSRLEHVETVFAMTVHKSQGSEFSHVLLVLPAQASAVLTRELVYTGLTRARDRLTLWAPQVDELWNACARRVWRSGGLGD